MIKCALGILISSNGRPVSGPFRRCSPSEVDVPSRGKNRGLVRDAYWGEGGRSGSEGSVDPGSGSEGGRPSPGRAPYGIREGHTPVLNMLDTSPSDVPHVTLDAYGIVTSSQCIPPLFSHPKKEYK